MPQVDVEVDCDLATGNSTSITLTQHDVLGEGGLWPIATEVELESAVTHYFRVNGQAKKRVWPTS